MGHDSNGEVEIDEDVVEDRVFAMPQASAAVTEGHEPRASGTRQYY
jgi:hypothetical protein